MGKGGGRVLDTHVGSGSSRIAAFDMGFEFYGYELDPIHFKNQEARFRRHAKQGQLFSPEQQYGLQNKLI